MKKSVLLVLAGLFVLCGCRTHYVMRLNNGGQITTSGKPKAVGNSYQYRDAKGQIQEISQGRVVGIEPASMAAKEKMPFSGTAPGK